VAFLDDDELAPAEGPGARRGGADRQRQILIRRLIALGVGVLLFILLALLVRSCLNERKERGFENYVSDLSSIVETSNQTAANFFERLQAPPENFDQTDLANAVATDRNAAAGLLERIDALDTPDELEDAEADLRRAFELRRDALEGIAAAIPEALGATDGDDGVEQIAGEMRALLASDVLYERARAEIQSELADQGIAEEVPESRFVPEPVENSLDELALAASLSRFAADAGAVKGVRGLELVSTTVEPGGIELVPGEENTVELDGEEPAFEVEVLNGGETEERDVPVTLQLSGTGTSIEAEAPLASVDPGGTDTVTIELDEVPETGVPLNLEVTVQFVPGEAIFDNNTQSYTVTFEE